MPMSHGCDCSLDTNKKSRGYHGNNLPALGYDEGVHVLLSLVLLGGVATGQERVIESDTIEPSCNRTADMRRREAGFRRCW